jgi:hypothetical protein
MLLAGKSSLADQQIQDAAQKESPQTTSMGFVHFPYATWGYRMDRLETLKSRHRVGFLRGNVSAELTTLGRSNRLSVQRVDLLHVC